MAPGPRSPEVGSLVNDGMVGSRYGMGYEWLNLRIIAQLPAPGNQGRNDFPAETPVLLYMCLAIPYILS